MKITVKKKKLKKISSIKIKSIYSRKEYLNFSQKNFIMIANVPAM